MLPALLQPWAHQQQATAGQGYFEGGPRPPRPEGQIPLGPQANHGDHRTQFRLIVAVPAHMIFTVTVVVGQHRIEGLFEKNRQLLCQSLQ